MPAENPGVAEKPGDRSCFVRWRGWVVLSLAVHGVVLGALWRYEVASRPKATSTGETEYTVELPRYAVRQKAQAHRGDPPRNRPVAPAPEPSPSAPAPTPPPPLVEERPLANNRTAPRPRPDKPSVADPLAARAAFEQELRERRQREAAVAAAARAVAARAERAERAERERERAERARLARDRAQRAERERLAREQAERQRRLAAERLRRERRARQARARQAYRVAVVTAVARAKFYPRVAVRRGREGTVVVEVTIGRTGRLALTPRVVSSSGHATLDAAALEATRRAAPFAPPPADLPEARVVFRLTLVYRLTD